LFHSVFGWEGHIIWNRKLFIFYRNLRSLLHAKKLPSRHTYVQKEMFVYQIIFLITILILLLCYNIFLSMLRTRSYKQKAVTPAYLVMEVTNYQTEYVVITWSKCQCDPAGNTSILTSDNVFEFSLVHLIAAAHMGLIRIIYLFIYFYFPNYLKTEFNIHFVYFFHFFWPENTVWSD
jgi:hypothetical protein